METEKNKLEEEFKRIFDMLTIRKQLLKDEITE